MEAKCAKGFGMLGAVETQDKAGATCILKISTDSYV